jgi:benzoate-CoA ligase
VNGAEHLLGAAALARHGARTALVYGGQTITYRELAAQVARAAGALRQLGVLPGERVLLLMRDTPQLAAAWLGALRCGAVAVALNTRLSSDEFRYIRADSGARLVIAEDRFAAARPDLSAELAREHALAVAGGGASGAAPSWDEALARASALEAAYDARPEEPAFWLYSSGTTGKPKGIVHAHRSVLPAGQAQREVLGLGPADTVFATSKLFFAYGLENGLLGPLANGSSAILHPEWAEAEAILALVGQRTPTAFFSVPTFYARLLALGTGRIAPFRAVHWFIAAGERLPAPLAAEWRAATGREILPLYGMSETFCVCMMARPGTPGEPRTGTPLAGVETRLLRPDGSEAQAREPALLWVRHPALALGYANRPEQTEAQFRDGWFCTGDMFVQDAAGGFTHQGRADELVKIAGQWVQPRELEEAAAHAPAVAEAACVPVTDAGGFERLALFVVARADPQEAIAAAGRACEERLPRFKRPHWIRAVRELPRTATGKVQRFRLRELLEQEFGPRR